jgi:hypothetical protein
MTGVLLALLGLWAIAFCSQPVKHMRLCHKVMNFQLMCSLHASPLLSRWHWNGQAGAFVWFSFDCYNSSFLFLSYSSFPAFGKGFPCCSVHNYILLLPVIALYYFVVCWLCKEYLSAHYIKLSWYLQFSCGSYLNLWSLMIFVLCTC